MEKMKKFLDFDVKAAEGEPGSFIFTASTSDRDRDGDVIVQEGWKLDNFLKNPVILWAHQYDQPPVGKAVTTGVVDGRLQMKIQFVPESVYPFAATIEKMVAQKFLRTMSVGFMVYRTEDLTEEDRQQRSTITYGKRLYAELLESSIVPVPANPMALGRSFGDLVAKSFGYEAPVEKESALLPYTKDGKVDGRLLRASFAALMGARGGVPVPADQRAACATHLRRIAKENGIDVPNISQLGDGSAPELHLNKLKTLFDDVWHSELLEVVQLGLEESDQKILPLLKGGTRKALEAAHQVLGRILDATEEKGPEEPSPEVTDLQKEVSEIIKDLAATTAALK